eukprot:TRINITY_DN25209_c0_g1_i1.p1 TRINITY_DN25209_c0_g1~~TRINITY_DN25209_c0_g1_i1.p1  ORF type:complete len:225 (+),score=18.78 TRINITY_DN25209_c0_g1_i1:45-677(+)
MSSIFGVVATATTPTLSQELETLWRSQSHSDVSFLAGGQSFPAHRVILSARCAKFRAMLESGMKESTQSEIKVDVKSAELFEYLLEFIYTDKVAFSRDCAEDLLYLADEYMLVGLKRICENSIISTVRAENVAAALEAAHSLHADGLKSFCMKYLADNLTDVMKIPNWKADLKSADLLQEVIEQIASSHSSWSRKRKNTFGYDTFGYDSS